MNTQETQLQTSDLRIESLEALISPRKLLEEFPARRQHYSTVIEGRSTIANILEGRDSRFLLIVGPCSIHNTTAALEYAKKLHALAQELKDSVYIVMRVYFEKPRTRLGWRGLIFDPHINDSHDIQEGLSLARNLLLNITEIGLPAGSEMLDPIVPQYIDDLLSWGSIGARTTESQTHREMASGLSMPIGFKNGTDGSIGVAIDAMKSSENKHSFIGIDQDGNTSVLRTQGNKHCHLILRGGHSGPNYFQDVIENTGQDLRSAQLIDKILVDCSHANSGKDHKRQHIVLENILEQRKNGVKEIMGAMIESNHLAGKQSIPEDPKNLNPGISITDSCIGWEETEELLRSIAR